MIRSHRALVRLLPILVAFFLLLLPACDDDDGPTGPGGNGPGPEPGVPVAYSIPPFDVVDHGVTMRAVWSDGVTTITAGDGGVAFVENDAGRFLLPLGVDAAVDMTAVSSTGTGKTYVTGTFVPGFDAESPAVLRFENGLRTRETIDDPHATSGVDCTVAVTYLTAHETLWKGVDGSWSPFAEFPGGCNDVFYAGSGLLFVAGFDGLHRYQEGTWTNVYFTSEPVICVGGFDEDQVMAAVRYQLISCDGSHEFGVVHGASEVITDVAWADADWAVAAGLEGTVTAYDGTSFDRVRLHFDADFHAVAAWRDGGGGVGAVVVGDHGARYRYDDGEWSGRGLGPGEWTDVTGAGLGKVFAIRRALVPGTGLTDFSTLHGYDGTTWQSADAPGGMRLYGLFSRGDGEAWALGRQDIDGFVVHWDGTQWSSRWVASLEIPAALWVDADDITYVACDYGTVYVNSVPETAVMPPQDLHGIWRDDDGDGTVFVVGDAGTVARRVGFTWSTMDAGTSADLYAVHGSSSSQVVAVGAGGTIRRFDGESWTSMNSGLNADLDEVWTRGSSNLWVGSSTGNRLAHWNGSTWRTIDVSALGSRTKSVWTNGEQIWLTVGSILARYAEPPAFEEVLGVE